eukprot:Plantae.Rhodophyta-Purpureofilum_apyrenoidigerum.ctg16697.p1 GENE.Plantae.Rhodophyta-Purpureofilum_apyrenoidigerum.ctg16697~~Plantae.Rhodophyta-Purpureofilum_apyrenoidigerum.ctg16697.p1  ORF type:complete len:270 (-),score=79.65 Plantae.Rhodophyta-Purpureofilum_apyrenoidigerum.ctg16697:67-876(-)
MLTFTTGFFPTSIARGRGEQLCSARRGGADVLRQVAAPSRRSRMHRNIVPTAKYAQQEINEEEFDDLDLPEDDGVVVLKDAQTNRMIECVVERTIMVDDVEYYLCSPCDDPVVIAIMAKDDGDSYLATVDEPEKLDKLFNPAYEVLAEEGITLQETAYIWTVIPDVDEDEEDGVDEDELLDEEDERQSGSVEWNGEEEEVEVIAEFFHEGTEYFVAKTVSPVFFVTKMMGDEMRVPEQDELDRITPTIEAELEKEWDHEASEDDIEKIS